MVYETDFSGKRRPRNLWARKLGRGWGRGYGMAMLGADADQVTPRQVVFFDHSQPTTLTTYSARMKAKIDSDRGRMIYAGRLGAVEPVFGNLRSNKGMNRFTMRGRRKNESQFRLYALVHNIEKLAHYAGDRW